MGVFGVRALTPKVVAFGVVEYSTPSPGATAVPPEGYYVTSMIFIDGLTKESLGKMVFLEGRLGSVPDSDGYQNYPKLFDTETE